MKVTQAGVTAVLTTVASTVAGVLPLLVEQRVLTASLAAVIGGFVASLTAGWHGNTAVVKRQAAAANTAPALPVITTSDGTVLTPHPFPAFLDPLA